LRANLKHYCTEYEDEEFPGIKEYRCWFNSKARTPLRFIDTGDKQDLPLKSRKRFFHLFDDSIAIIVCLNLGDYDVVYRDKPNGGCALLFHRYYRQIREALHTKYLCNKPVIIILYRGDFDAKILESLRNPSKQEDISVLFPEYNGKCSNYYTNL
jgi:hypothetical protein